MKGALVLAAIVLSFVFMLEAQAQTKITMGSNDSKVIFGHDEEWDDEDEVWDNTYDLGVCGYDTSDSRWEYRGSVSYSNMRKSGYVVTIEGGAYGSPVSVEPVVGEPIKCYEASSGGQNRRIDDWLAAWTIGLTLDFSYESFATINGSPKDDIIYGSDDDGNVIDGGSGDDEIHGGYNVDDDISGGPGLDTIYGQGASSYDRIYGDEGGALLICAGYEDSGEPYDCGCDDVEGYAYIETAETMPMTGAHYAVGCGGADRLYGFEDDTDLVMRGGDGNDRLYIYSGNAGYGEGGQDTMVGDGESIAVVGGAGVDTITAEGNELYVHGGDGGDTITVTGYSAGLSYDPSYVFGGDGDDTINLDSNDMIVCGDNEVSAWNWDCDQSIFSDGDDTITGDNLTRVEIYGAGGCDEIYGGSKALYSLVYIAGGTYDDGDQGPNCDDVDGGTCARCTCDDGDYQNCEDWGSYSCGFGQGC